MEIREKPVGITKVQVSSKMDENNALFLDWLCNQGKPFPTSRSWWVNECMSLIRVLFRSGQLAIPISTLQQIPRIPSGIPSLPHCGAVNEPGLPPTRPTQARFNFFSHLRDRGADRGAAAMQSPSFPSELRSTFALRIA